MDDTEMVFASGQVYLSPPLFQKCCETYQKKKGVALNTMTLTPVNDK
jgi:hypothetical protein